MASISSMILAARITQYSYPDMTAIQLNVLYGSAVSITKFPQVHSILFLFVVILITYGTTYHVYTVFH